MTIETVAQYRYPTVVDGAEAYRVRPFEAEDREAVLALDNGHREDRRAFFDWLPSNPFVEHVPIAVVERAGKERDGENDERVGENHEPVRDIVGALPFLAVPVRGGGQERVALVPGSLLADHGTDEAALGRRALDGAIDFYAAAAVGSRPPTDVDIVTGTEVDADAAGSVADPPAFVAVPSDFAAADGDGAVAEPDDAEQVDETSKSSATEAVRWDRIQRHGALLGQQIPLGGVLGAPISLAKRPIRNWRDSRAPFDTEQFTVMSHDWVPDATLSSCYECYEASMPASAHVALTEPFIDWWYRLPDGPPTTSCVAYRGNEVAAALVAERETVEGVLATWVIQDSGSETADFGRLSRSKIYSN